MDFHYVGLFHALCEIQHLGLQTLNDSLVPQLLLHLSISLRGQYQAPKIYSKQQSTLYPSIRKGGRI